MTCDSLLRRTLRYPAGALLLSLAGSFAPPALAALISLGDAGDFNALVFGDMVGRQSDVEGRLGVRGNADLRDFNLGLQLPNSNGSRDDLIVGGDASLYDGRLNHGNGVYGGDLHTDNTFGLYSDDDPHTPNGTLRQGDSSDFFQRLYEEVAGKATHWSQLAATGTTQVRRNISGDIWEVAFEGGEALNIFDIHASELGAWDKSIRFSVPQASVSLINVRGKSAELAHSGFYHSAYAGGPSYEPSRIPDNVDKVYRHDGAFTNGILFNFFEATSLSMHSIGVKGSVLAPFADLSFHNGHIDGNLIVDDWLYEPLPRTTGDDRQLLWHTGQVNDYRFRGEVPVPATLLLLLAGLPLLRVRRRPRSCFAEAVDGCRRHRATAQSP